MDKAQLQKIFSTAYNHENWLEVLKQVFGAKQLLMQPRPISLVSNDITDGAFELGNITTSDDRIIGLYKIDVKSNVWLERNKVGLRKLLRDVYKYDVDGALIVFVQENKWRLSFVSEVKVLNDEGEIVKEVTEPKRYTYLLGEGEKVQTPSIFISKLINKIYSLEDIRKSFSVDVLNEEFYKIIQQKFYELVGGKIGSTKKQTDFGDGKLILPGITKEARQVYQEFGVRLIGRTVFCWFLKMKKENNGEPLISETLLSSKAVKANQNYYHTVLERLFFQTLNTPMDERLDNLPKDCEKVPFLNGGLFEPSNDDYYRFNKLTGLSEHINTLLISDSWFLSFFEELEKYNFTIDENSVTDVEVSVDPEMLGRIFENLLAEIDPDSGDTARKATGSFYTPREIVDYMAIESLLQYIHNKTSIEQERLRDIFRMSEQNELDFSDSERTEILKALDTVKILDPACGSGAFPMGVLQKIVVALQKLDKNAEWWIQQRINENKNATARKAVKEKLEGNSQYARKIGIIQNSLYGVDILPIAAEISKLRCFLTLVVDERIDDSKPNRGIDPLPNLEFKFVTANTLLKLPEQQSRGLFDHFEELEELEQLRIDYLQSSGKEKQKIKERFPIVQKKIFKEQMNLFVNTESRAYKLSTWNPFGHDKADWFDPKWMYGVEKFDIVIGNPPYVLLQNAKLSESEQSRLRKGFVTAQYKTDLYHLFIEIGLKCAIEAKGILCYITPNTFLKNKHNDLLRKFILETSQVNEIIRFFVPIFKNASVDNAIIIASRSNKSESHEIKVKDVSTISDYVLKNTKSILIPQSSLMKDSYSFDFDQFDDETLATIKQFQPLEKIGRAYFGIQTNDRKAYVSKEKIDEQFKPVVDGANVNRYFLISPNEYVNFTKTSIKSGGNVEVYEQERILVRQIGKYPEGCLSKSGIYTLNTIYNIFLFEKSRIKLRFLLGIINSNTIKYYWLKTHSDSKETFPKIKKKPLESIPIPDVKFNIQVQFANMVDYVNLLKTTEKESEQINEYVSNNHLALMFEELLDAMVMEIYFKENFQKAEIEFIKYVERDFESIEGKSQSEQIKIIHRAYQKLREKNNEIRNNLKLMDLKLSHIVIPIKTAR